MYDVAPASDVTVTRADGTTETVAAQAPKAAGTPSRCRGPLVCAFCGYPIDGRVSRRQRGAKGKPVHAGGCGLQEPPKRATKTDPASTVRRAGGRGGNADQSTGTEAVEPDLARKVTCPRCQAAPGSPCQKMNANGVLVVIAGLHRDRFQVVQRVLAAAQDKQQQPRR